MPGIKATVIRQNGKKAESRGFSLTELKNAGLTKQDAKKIGIPLDIKRKSAHDENVETLKAHAEKAKTEAKPKKPKSEAQASPEEEKPKKKSKE